MSCVELIFKVELMIVSVDPGEGMADRSDGGRYMPY